MGGRIGTHLAQGDTLIFSIYMYIGRADLFFGQIIKFQHFWVFSKNDNFWGWRFVVDIFGAMIILIC